MSASVVERSGFLATDSEVLFDSHCYHIFREVVGLERGRLSLVITIEGLSNRPSLGTLWTKAIYIYIYIYEDVWGEMDV
jgi:hypothetical protein